MKYLVLVCLVAGLSFQAEARRGKHKGKMRGMMKELNLTEEQQTKMKEMRKTNKAETKALWDKVKTAKEALKNGWATNADDATLTSLHTALWNAKTAARTKGFSNRLAVRGILTDEQRKMFSEKMSKNFSRKMAHGDTDGMDGM